MSSYRKSLVAVCSLALCGFLFPSAALAYDIQIDVAPNVLNIQSESVVVTVHTDVAYSLVAGSTVFLNGVAISHWKQMPGATSWPSSPRMRSSLWMV